MHDIRNRETQFIDNRLFESYEKDVSLIKLTVAVNRITLKLPFDISRVTRKRYESYSFKIVELLGEIPQTVRGQFRGNFISLRTKHGSRSNYKEFRSFNYDELV